MHSPCLRDPLQRLCRLEVSVCLPKMAPDMAKREPHAQRLAFIPIWTVKWFMPVQLLITASAQPAMIRVRLDDAWCITVLIQLHPVFIPHRHPVNLMLSARPLMKFWTFGGSFSISRSLACRVR